MERSLRKVSQISNKSSSSLCSYLFVVSRISGKLLISDCSIELDVNTDIYPMEENQEYKFSLANYLGADGADEYDLFRPN